MNTINRPRSLLMLLFMSIFMTVLNSCNANGLKLEEGLYTNFITSKGSIIVELFPEKAPLTVMNFVGLAEGKLDFANKEGAFYDGLTFHRVIEDFMIQGGDPQGTGTGGPGYNFPDETDNGLQFDAPGILAMANAGPNTNGSQFFITHVPTAWLNGNHTIFGRVVEGQDVVNAIEQGDIMEKVEILRIGPTASDYNADAANFQKIKADILEQQKVTQQERMDSIMNEIVSRWPDAILDEETGIYSLIHNQGSGSSPTSGTLVTVHYTGTLMNKEQFDSSRDRNEPFQFNVGTGQVIPGWDASILKMKKGERRTIILPPDMAYGKRGAGPIAPNSWLVFDVELLDFEG